MEHSAFDDLAAVFDRVMDWPRRLAAEEPFYRNLFARVGAQRVLDVACGVGHHAAMFHRWGMQVQGADLSPAMIARARENHGEPAGLPWVERSFDQPVDEPGTYDVVICVGNSLALAPDLGIVHRAVGCMMQALRPGGVAVVQVLNLWSMADGPMLWQKFVRADLPIGPALIIKGVHRCGNSGYVELLVVPQGNPAGRQTQSVRFLGLDPADLDAAFRQAGAAQVSLHGGYRSQPYDREGSTDLMVVATRS